MNKYSVLIVDDEPANIYLLEELLSEHNVTSVKSGIEMFKELEKNIPDLILLDIMMPGMDGLTAARQLKADLKFRNIPVIFISAKNSGEDAAAGLNTGAEDYIKKPFNNVELTARISKVLNNKEKKTALYRKATRDSLTGLFNRDYFFESLAFIIRKSERENLNFSLGIIDIDHFKNVNDTWGHQAGDRILVNLAQFINKSLREYDVLARYGGEEFVFIVDGILKNQAMLIIDRIRQALEATELDAENHIFISFSCGLTDISEASDRADVVDSLVKIADRRLYLAKERGRNLVIADD